MSHTFRPIEVEIELKDRILFIKFDTADEARQYITSVSTKPAASTIDLKSSKKEPKWISLKLPDTIVKIVASGGREGFYFSFRDATDAEAWERDLLIWKRIKKSVKNKLFVDRSIKVANNTRPDDAEPSTY
ncbi:hypothetical protein E8E14_000044, partial [Neopestalotiopsis sp. 37M]